MTLLKQGQTLTSRAERFCGGSTESVDEELLGRCLQRSLLFEKEEMRTW